ncbi:E3 ubiquitin-protein ligase TRIM39-like [Pleurodeles waltl]|uniref:E3 ubiquitin-protein ligase TRIM39-like n=1 Tax=Pleurodeles waltl TaxID=8319 RepID=UPI003709C207
MTEMMKRLQIAPGGHVQRSVCEEHEGRLQCYCDSDLVLLCEVCRESPAHRAHRVTLVKEAEQEYKNQVRAEQEKITFEIGQLRRFLRDQEQTLYGRLKEMEKTITMVENANISKLSNQITSLNALITDLEKKCKEPALDLLKDARSLLMRCNTVKFRSPAKVMATFKVMVTLDPDTAHPRLVLSEGGRRVGGTNRAQLLPDAPKRFTYWRCVLGGEGFTSGRHYWEVQLLQEGGWRVGVTAESVKRKEWIPWSPQGGVWAVEGWNGLHCALTSPETPLFPSEKPLNLGVYLDYEGGWLSLCNADSMELLYTFPRTPFKHRLFPFFCLWGGAELRLV